LRAAADLSGSHVERSKYQLVLAVPLLLSADILYPLFFSTYIYSRTLLPLHVVLYHHVVLLYDARQNGVDVLGLAAQLFLKLA